MKNLKTLLIAILLITNHAFSQVNIDWSDGSGGNVIIASGKVYSNAQSGWPGNKVNASNALTSCNDGWVNVRFVYGGVGAPAGPTTDWRMVLRNGVTDKYAISLHYTGGQYYLTYTANGVIGASNVTTHTPGEYFGIECVGGNVYFHIGTSPDISLNSVTSSSINTRTMDLQAGAWVDNFNANLDNGTCSFLSGCKKDYWQKTGSSMSPVLLSDKIGIGTSTPITKLHVSGQSLWLTDGDGGGISNAGSGLRLYYDETYDVASIFSYRYGMDYSGTKDIYMQSPGGSVAVGYDYISSGHSFWYGGGGITTGNPQMGDVRLDVNGITRTSSLVVTSDQKFKKNITNIDGALQKVLKLQGVTYNWKKDEFPKKNFDNLKQIGFIAQEVEKVIPEAIIKDEKGEYALNYIMLIPMLTEAIKEQQKQIEDLKSQVAATKTSNPGINDLGVKLYQNNPNPFSENTTINYFIPQNITDGQVIIYDMGGRLIKSYSLQTNGNGTININAGELTPGSYIYSMMAGGKIIDSKIMVMVNNK